MLDGRGRVGRVVRCGGSVPPPPGNTDGREEHGVGKAPLSGKCMHACQLKRHKEEVP